MPAPEKKLPEYVDGFGPMERGVNTGISSRLLPPNQLASGLNLTIRGDYINPRPARNKIPLTFSGATAALFSGQPFQGACFYQADSGAGSIMAAINGHLVQIAISANIGVATDVSISGDFNTPGLIQSWLWQSENYVIVNDGSKLPLLFNGQFTVRSAGQTPILLGTALINFAAPAINSSVTITLASNYSGPINSTILIDAAYYEITGTGTSTRPQVVLTNISDTPGHNIPIASQIINIPSIIAISNQVNYPYGPLDNAPAGSQIVGVQFYPISGSQSPSIGDVISYEGIIVDSGSMVTTGPIQKDVTHFGIATAAGPSGITVLNRQIVPVGTNVIDSNISTPNSTIANTLGSFIVPALNATVLVAVDTAYTGPLNSLVFINRKGYLINPGPPLPGSPNVTALNINDAAGTVHGPNPPATSPGNITTLPQLPAGRMGAYGMGRNWMSLTDGRSFVASDIVGGASGTPSQNDRDAPLRITENTFLFEGGLFVIPGSGIGFITAMVFSATLDVSLGQGPLQVFTQTNVFSCNAPVDRTTWSALTNPILTESLIANGGTGQNSTTLANGDILMRSLDGVRSLVLARREFSTWGNVPQSREVQPLLNLDNTSTLAFGSSITFSNRYLQTATPTSSPCGIFHPNTVVINFDPLSTLNSKSPAAWDGQWTGLNVLQYITGIFSGTQRCFALTVNTTLTPNTIELYEILADGILTKDNNTTPIVMDFSTGDLFKKLQNKTADDFCRLRDGELYVDQVVGPVSFQVFYKPDQFGGGSSGNYPGGWVPWYAWSVDGKSPFYPRMGFGEPSPNDLDPVINRPLREAFTFQIRLVITGSCRVLSCRVKALYAPTPEFAVPIPRNV